MDAPLTTAARTMHSSPNLSVVIPTYKEVDNLQAVSESVRSVLSPLECSYELIFVDDDSQDGSEQLVNELAMTMPVQMIVRHQERGPASAVIDGIRSARGQYVIVMDADLSHPAAKIPDMLRLLETGAHDLVIGSRYIAGGSVDRSCSWLRRRSSRVATWLARPLTNVRDPMSGFLAFRRDQMPDQLALAPVDDQIGLELLVKGDFERPGEVPIAFQDRRHGESKRTLRAQIHYIQHLRSLYHYRYPLRTEFVLFGAVGATGFAVDVSIFLGLQFTLGMQHQLARALSFWGSASWNWACNRAITFSSCKQSRKRLQWPAFILSSMVGFLLNWGTYYGLTTWVPFFDGTYSRILAMLFGVAAGMGLNFLLARRFVFATGDESAQPSAIRAEASELPHRVVARSHEQRPMASGRQRGSASRGA